MVGTFLIAAAVSAADGGAVARLLEALRSPDEKARIEAMDALARLGPGAQAAVTGLTAQLDDKSPRIRAHAARALRSIGPAAKDAGGRLAQLAADPDVHVRRLAIEALHSVQPEASVALPALAKALGDADPAVRVAALDAMTDYGEPAAVELAKALENPDTRYWAALALGELGPQAKPAVAGLTKALEDDRPDVKYEVLIALAHVGPDAEPAVPALVKSLTDANAEVQVAAAFALGHVGPPAAAAAAESLRKAMTGGGELLPTVSAWALARLEPENEAVGKQAVEMLEKQLNNEKPQVRMAALRGLVGLVGEPGRLVPILTKAVAVGDPAVTAEALAVASSLGETAVPVLIEALKQPEGRGRAAAMIAQLGSKANATVPALAAALDDKNVEVRRELLFALASMHEAAAPVQSDILNLLADPDVRVRAIAAYALGSIGVEAKAAVPRLQKEIESADPVVRVASAWALVRLAPRDKQLAATTLPVLMQGLKNENVAVRRGSADALGLLGPLARSAAPALRDAARDSDESVAKAALVALERVGGIIIRPTPTAAPQRRR